MEVMAKKTAIKKVLKLAPLKTACLRAIASDETIKSELAEDMTEMKGDMLRRRAVLRRKECGEKEKGFLWKMQREHSLFKYQMISGINRKLYDGCRSHRGRRLRRY
jgi:hypothetical protein